MAKAKYKLGTLVEYTVAGGTNHGQVDGVLTRNEGYSYSTKGMTDFISENDIISAYRPVTTRAKKTTAKTKVVTKKKSANQENSLNS